MNNIMFRPNYKNVNSDINRFLGDVFNRPLSECVAEKAVNKSFAFSNIEELEDRFVVHIAVPGFAKDQITINIEKNKMTVAGKKESDTNIKYNLREFKFDDFSRSFNLPEDIKSDNIEATFENGVLSIDIPKSEKAAPKTIEVK
ncbi:MAG: Hsp20/alpha crystallin family protein [Saprospiraceae bacterium]|nr:Hsp20/alpha crystallin family protein [Saprospiraceae bacterium]